MKSKPTNPCIRCGKERIVIKTWTEEVTSFFGKGVITHTESACPDKECQKVVDDKNNALREKKEKIEHDKAERAKKVLASRGKSQTTAK